MPKPSSPASKQKQPTLPAATKLTAEPEWRQIEWDAKGAIFDLLKNSCGAPEILRSEFMMNWPCTAFRFQGDLGYGGRIWLRKKRPPEVRTNPEDFTVARDRAVKATNEALAKLLPRGL